MHGQFNRVSSQVRIEGEKERPCQLINATLSTIADEGLSRTTLAKVAARARLSPGIVNFYFRTKGVLLIETLRYLAEGFEAALNNTLALHRDDPSRALRAVVSLKFDERYSAAEHLCAWNAFLSESLARIEYREICTHSQRLYFESLKSLCAELVETGHYAHVCIDGVARVIDGMVESLLKDLLLQGDEFDRAAAKTTCMSFLASVFSHHFSGTEARHDGHVQTEAVARLLAPWTYFDSELLSIEIDVLFKRNWQLIGHVSDVSGRGDYKSCDLLDEQVLVIRGDDSKLRAFHNVCRHRGSRVIAPGKGNCPRSIICPFHGWSYRLDGRLQGIPQAHGFGNLDQNRLGLVPLEVEVWMGLIFVRFKSSGRSVAELMEPLEKRLTPYGIAAMQPVGEDFSQEVKVNWKSMHDIDNEGYHIPVGHPSLNSLLVDYRDEILPNGVTTSEAKITDVPSRYWSVARYQKLPVQFDHLPNESRRSWFYWGMFPNVSLAVYPEGLEYYRTVPIDAETTLMVGGYYALPDDRREVRAARYLNERINRIVTREDYQLVQRSYESMRSSVFPRDRLSELESGVASFHDLIREQIPVAGEDKPPSHGTVAARNETLISLSKKRMPT